MVNHGEGADLHADSVNHQCVAFIMADGITKPGRSYLPRMGLVETHLTHLMIKDIEDRYFVRLLQHLHAEIPKHKWHAARPTFVRRIGRRMTAKLDFTMFFHRFRRLRPQNRIGEVSCEWRPG